MFLICLNICNICRSNNNKPCKPNLGWKLETNLNYDNNYEEEISNIEMNDKLLVYGLQNGSCNIDRKVLHVLWY